MLILQVSKSGPHGGLYNPRTVFLFQTLKRKSIQIHTIIQTPTTKQLNGETGTIQNERDTMVVYYHVLLQSENGENSIIRTFNSDTDTNNITEEMSHIQKLCSHFNWSQPGVSEKIGKSLFTVLNGSKKLLESAITTSDKQGEPLQLFIEEKGGIPDLPFELLYDSGFLVPSKIHVIRRISDYGCEKKVESKNRPLKVLFMACSPQDVLPVLDFEKEEEIILDVTKNLPVDIDVEETGSLQGLYERLEANEYDVIHVTGHANIKDGKPYFCMEDEEGFLEKVTPLKLQDVLSEALERPLLPMN